MVLVALAFLVVALTGMRGPEGSPAEVGDYLFLLLFAATMWPLYMLAVGLLSRRARRFRVRAVALAPLLGLPLNFALLLVNVPEMLAAWLFYLSFGLTVRRPWRKDLSSARCPAHAGSAFGTAAGAR